MSNIRKEYIKDCVDHYIKNYPQDYADILRNIEDQRKKLSDSKFGKFDKEMRLGFRLPDKLLNMIQIGLNGHEVKKFLEEKDEDVWFAKRFSQFLIPKSY